jgi:hypothetical protein
MKELGIKLNFLLKNLTKHFTYKSIAESQTGGSFCRKSSLFNHLDSSSPMKVPTTEC